MDSRSAVTRPLRSAIQPKRAPTKADAASGMASSRPLTQSSMPKVARTRSRTNEYSRTSIASSIQPSEAAIRARRASGLAGMRQGADGNAGGLEDRADVAREGGGARRVAVQADGVSRHRNHRPIDGNHAALCRNHPGLGRDGVCVLDDGAGTAARDERAVGLIGAVRERLGRYAKPGLAGD